MEQLRIKSLGGILSWKQIHAKITSDFRASFTLDWLKHFWPVYLYWIVFFLERFSFLFFLHYFLTDNEDDPTFFPDIFIYNFDFVFSWPMLFFIALSCLFCLYFLILKKYKYVFSSVGYIFIMLVSFVLNWKFTYDLYEFISTVAICNQTDTMPFCH